MDSERAKEGAGRESRRTFALRVVLGELAQELLPVEAVRGVAGAAMDLAVVVRWVLGREQVQPPGEVEARAVQLRLCGGHRQLVTGELKDVGGDLAERDPALHRNELRPALDLAARSDRGSVLPLLYSQVHFTNHVSSTITAIKGSSAFNEKQG